MQTPPDNGNRVQDELKRLIPEQKELIAWFVLAVAFVAFSWTSLFKLGHVWWSQEDYQHGFVVPLFSLFLLYWRREMILPFKGRGSWWGLAFFAVWAAMRLMTVYFNYESLPEMSIVPFFAGVALLVGGWQGLRWAWPSVLFLVFMIPLPGAVQDLARLQLQQIATKLSVFVIQTLGIPAVQDSVVIQMTDRPLRVVEACSGLRMMSLFFAACIGAAFLIRKPLWEKLLLIVSAVPIAIAANVTRISLTAVLCELGRQWPSVINPEHAEKLVHDGAGLLMPIVGLLMLWAEVVLLSKLMIAPLPQRPLVLGRLAAGKVTGAAGRHPVGGDE